MIRSREWNSHEWDYCLYKRDPRELCYSFCLVRTQGNGASTNQEVGSQQTLTLLTPLIMGGIFKYRLSKKELLASEKIKTVSPIARKMGNMKYV